MEQTAQQRANSLNPTPATFYLPSTDGLFRGVGDYGSQLYRRTGNRIESVNLLNPSLGLYAAGTVGAGNQSSQALAALKNQYGLDWNSLAQVNLGDLNSQGYNQGLQVASKAGPDGGPDNFFHSFSGGLQDFLGAKQNVQTAPVMVNTQANALTPITPQSIESGIKNLQTPTVLSSQQQKDYFASQGSAAKPLSPTDWLNKINTESSKGATPLSIATSTSTTTKADSTAAGADTTAKSIQDYINLLTPEANATSTGVKNLLASITADLEGLKGRGTAQLSAEDAQGVAVKKQILQNAQTELNQKLAEYKAIQAKYEALNTDIEGKAITMNSIIGSQAQVERAMRSELNMKSSEIAMIQANVAGAQGNLTLAQEAANRAVDLKYEDAKDAIEIRMKQLELFQGELTKEEKIRTDAINLYLADQKTKLATQVANEKDKNATLLNQMQKYPDAGITLSDTIESANTKITTKSAIYRKETGNTTNNTGYTLTPTQLTDPFLKSLANSAGGKPLTDTPLNQLNKGFTVLGQLGALQSNIEGTNTGPLVGLFRGANPWDTNAQTIKAQLNAIVPNLARGIYGEVGVLTDNDIRLYSQTLPNLKSTEDLRSAVLYITIDQIAKSIKTTLDVQRSGGRDVSGFVEMYDAMRATKDSILSTINVQATAEEKDVYGSVVSSGSSGSLGGFFSDIWKGLTGK